MRFVATVTVPLAAVLAACGGSHGATPTASSTGGSAGAPAMPPGATLEIASIMGAVRNIDKGSACPMVLHYDGSLLVTGYTGKVRYRWERSTGINSAEHTVNAKAPTGNDITPIQLESDEWILAKGDKGGTFTDRIHVLTPADKLGQPNALMAACK